MAKRRCLYSGGVVNSVSSYRRVYYKRKYGTDQPNDSDSVAIDHMLREYHSSDITAERKAELKKEILLRAFFLFPYYLKKNYFMTAEMFNDAMQNMTCNALQAIDLFKPELGYPFSNYLIGYFRDAAAKTFKACNVVSVPSMRKAAVDSLFPEEDEDEVEETPFFVTGSDDPEDYTIEDTPPSEEYTPLTGEELCWENVETDECDDASLTEPVRKNQIVIRGAARVLGNAVELDDSRQYALAQGLEKEINVDERIHNAQLIDWLEEGLSKEAGVLTDDERFVLVHHYGLFGKAPLKYDEIAAIRRRQGRGSACSRISQINTAAVKKMRTYFQNNGIME